MGEGGLATHQEKARRRGANLLLMDESGLLMAPLVRRSSAPKGRPSVIEQEAGHRERCRSRRPCVCRPRGTGLGWRPKAPDPWPLTARANRARTQPVGSRRVGSGGAC
jgi:hypothetical protein